MAYGTAEREVTLVFKEIGRDVRRKPIYQRAGFNFVSYDGDPDRFVEPVNPSAGVDLIGTAHTILQTPSQVERVVGFEFIRGRLSECVAFSPDNVSVS